jgi:phosphate transport system permease protein
MATNGRSKKIARRRSSLFTRGEGMVWLTGGALVVCMAMVVGLLVLVFARGSATFWPKEVVRVETRDGRVALGAAFAKSDTERTLLTGNRSAERRQDFTLIPDADVTNVTEPEWALFVERLEWGPAVGVVAGFRLGTERAAETPEAAWALFERHYDEVHDRVEEIREIKEEIGGLDKDLEATRLAVSRSVEAHGEDSSQHGGAQEEAARVDEAQRGVRKSLGERLARLVEENGRYALVLSIHDYETPGGKPQEMEVLLSEVVRAHAPNRMGWFAKVGVYVARWWEFLTDNPRESNSEGGVYPAIVGTVVMTMLMTLLVVPFGVLGALYLREYARQGAIVSMVRIAVNNLAGVPSIVFGVFGLGFFCYIVGGSIDNTFFADRLPSSPTLGKPGLLWASLTLSLLTLPVVVVATEEALAAVPNSMREGSYACGASKWQTIRRIVLPRAMPGIMTGMILAIARGAGEVAPLMLTGAAKAAEHLPVDGSFPFVHPERSFMHLGFQIYDVSSQSRDAKALEGMVMTTTLLLITIVVVLNLTAVWLRGRLRRAYWEG